MIQTQKKQPIRTCAGCANKEPKDRLIRFVLVPQNGVVPDVSSSHPGRGAYLHPNYECFVLAAKRKGFSRAFKQEVKFDPRELAQTTIAALEAYAKQLAGLAARAKLVVSGGNMVQDYLKHHKASCGFIATDASRGVAKKFEILLETKGIPVHYLWDKSTWGKVLGTAERSVVVFDESGLGKKFLLTIEKIKSLETETI